MQRPLLILTALLVGCPGGPTDDTDPVAPIAWEPALQADDQGAFLMVWADGAGDVWIVGGQPETGVVLRGTHGALSPVALPEGTPLLNWVHGSGPDDVWVGGLSGTVLHWDGSAWEDRSLQVDEAVWGLHAVSDTEVWAVGGSSAWGGEQAVLAIWTGEAWESRDVPEVLGDLGNLFKVHHDGVSVWACGLGGAAVKSTDGTSFSALPTGYSQDIVTVHGLPGQPPIFVGGRGTGNVLEVDGDGLSVSASVRSGLSGVRVLPSGQAVVVGERGFAGVFDPVTDTLIEAPVPTEDVLHGVTVDDSGAVWAAGGNLYTAGDSFLGSVWVGALQDAGS